MPVRVAIGLCHATAEVKRIRIVEDVQDVGTADADETRVIEALENLLIGDRRAFLDVGTCQGKALRFRDVGAEQSDTDCCNPDNLLPPIAAPL